MPFFSGHGSEVTVCNTNSCPGSSGSSGGNAEVEYVNVSLFARYDKNPAIDVFSFQ